MFSAASCRPASASRTIAPRRSGRMLQNSPDSGTELGAAFASWLMRPAGSGKSRLRRAAKLETCASGYHHVAEKNGGDAASASESRSAANLFRREGQQHIARHTISGADVSRSHIQHAVNDDRAGSAERSALPGHAIDRSELMSRVVLPQRVTVGGRKRVQHAIPAAGKNHAGN